MFNRMSRTLRRAVGLPPGPHPYPEQFEPDMDMARFAGRPHMYLIASTPRCGSHFLGHALGATGDFGVPMEYLNPGSFPFWTKRLGTKSMPDLIAALVPLRTSTNGRFGLKAHWSQFEPHADRSLFAPYGGLERAIFLYRRDLLAQAISLMRAAQTRQYISGSEKQGPQRYFYDRIIRRAAGLRAQNVAWSAYLRERFDKPFITVVYEDLVANQATEFARVARFFDGDAAVAPTASERTQRQSDGVSDDWRQRFLSEMRDQDRWILEPQQF